MKDLRDGGGVECESDDDKLRALVDRTSFKKEQETVTTENGAVELSRKNWKEGMSNRSAPGPDGISYRFIKAVLNARLSRGLVREIGSPRSASCLRWSLYRRRIRITELQKGGGRHVGVQQCAGPRGIILGGRDL